jgi:superfamily II DNA or RNA helicase
MIHPYQYQADILDAVRSGWDLFVKQLIVSPTGSGKTIMFALMALDALSDHKKTLILVDQDELVWQALDKLKTATGITGQPEKAEHHAELDAQVVVATVQSMSNRLDKFPADHFGLVIADEADKSISKQWQKVLTHFDPHAKVAGFTATPHRTDQRNLGCYYENCIERENLFSLINKGYLSAVNVLMLPIKIDLSAVHVSDGDFDTNELDEIIGPHLLKIAEAVRDHAAFRKTLIFLPLVKTCQKFVEIGRSIGLSVDFVHGKDPERETKLQRYRDGGFDVLANSSLLTRGYDDTSIDCIVPTRPTKSVTLYFQMVGRGTRIAPGKRNMLLMDFLYQSAKHLVCRPANLIASNDLQAQAITEVASSGMPADLAAAMPVDLQTMANDATARREASLRKQLEAHKNKKHKSISADEFAFEHGHGDLADYEPAMAWELKEVTGRQAKYLKQAKIDLATVRGQGHASRLLDVVFRELKTPKMASPKAVALMHRMPGLCHQVGITDLDNVTTAQAGRFFAALNKRKKEPELV